ncbi:Exosome non-catalytic core component [Spiromyces aspiralis]|uniref:Exosome non-catalytic core component n=1 Tax=Spiromyces aspiralis TaxID=68401 RepID=A0ACC1HDU1_9FUNG|nr:Exosome non-catalytic core component [Spiromyces aspiralis]
MGLRTDGRRADELRKIACRASVLRSSDGSAYYEQGNTKVLAAVYGPRECRHKSQAIFDRAFINVEFNIAPFSTNERRKRSKSDKRLLEVSSFIKQTFEPVVMTTLYPRSQIDIYLHLFQHDGGTLEACINAATLALIDAGIPMLDYVCACTAGYVENTPILDLNHVEEASPETPDLTVAILPRTKKIALLQMESKLHADRMDEIITAAMHGCLAIHAKLDEAVMQVTKTLSEKLDQ